MQFLEIKVWNFVLDIITSLTKIRFHSRSTCIITVVVSFQVINNALDTDKMVNDYETMTSDLLEWIEQTIVILNDRQFANSLNGVQQQLAAFNTYRKVEKPPK